MNQHSVCSHLVILAGALLFSAAADAHPNDSPLTFIPHRNDNGATIYTNIPKKCFVNGLLICAKYHPLFPKTPAD